MMEAEPKRIDPGDQPTPRKATETRRRIALLVLLATIGVGVYLFAPKIPHDVEVRLNFVHMERGPKKSLTFRDLRRIQVDVLDDGQSRHRILVPARRNGLASTRFTVSLKPGHYILAVTMWFDGRNNTRVRERWQTALRVSGKGTHRIDVK